MNRIYLICMLLLATWGLQAQNGHRIAVTIDGFSEKELYLGYYYGDKQYLRDTATANSDGAFVFEGDETLEGGMYLVVLPPNNDFFQILIDEKEQHFSITTKADNLSGAIQFTGAPDNQLFYDYLDFLGQQRPKAESINKKMEEATTDNEKSRLQEELQQINELVKKYQQKLVSQHPKSLAAAIVKANMNEPAPEFEGTPEEQQRQQWYYTRRHFFDNIDLSDPRLLRTPFLFQRIDTYVEKLHFQVPDSLKTAVDDVLTKVKPAPETFKYYLIHFLNEYAASKIVGMDAVYVHIAKKYYGTGQATWTEEEQLKKILDNANKLEPLLIGKTAPNIRMQKRDGSTVELHDVNSDYTVLYLWRYDCGHCKSSTPYMKSFYEKFKDKGVKIFAVCVKFKDEVKECWDYIDENEIGDWLHTVDPYGRSRFHIIYNIETTPQIYILDKNKEIVMKRIGAEQLEEVMDKIIEMNKKEKEQSGERR